MKMLAGQNDQRMPESTRLLTARQEQEPLRPQAHLRDGFFA